MGIGFQSFLEGFTQGGLFGGAKMPGAEAILFEETTNLEESQFRDLLTPFLEMHEAVAAAADAEPVAEESGIGEGTVDVEFRDVEETIKVASEATVGGSVKEQSDPAKARPMTFQELREQVKIRREQEILENFILGSGANELLPRGLPKGNLGPLFRTGERGRQDRVIAVEMENGEVVLVPVVRQADLLRKHIDLMTGEWPPKHGK